MSIIEKTTTLQEAMNGSWYTIIGAGGDLQEWINGYEKLMAENEIGKPSVWYSATGAQVNAFIGETGREQDKFADDLSFLFFPLDGLDIGRLAIFKLRMQDRWFDDIVDNTRREF